MDRNEKARVEARQNKERQDKLVAAVKEIEEGLPAMKDLLVLKKKDLNIITKTQEIVLKKPKKLSPEYEYEQDEQYIKLMEERQLVINDMLLLNKNQEIIDLEKKIAELEDTHEDYSNQIKFKGEMK